MLQLTKQLFEHVWSQWCFDTQQIASGLPQALANQTPGQPLLLSLERWLILLKVPHPIKSLCPCHASANEALATPEVSMQSCDSTVHSTYTQQSLLMGLALYIWTHALQCSDRNLCLQRSLCRLMEGMLPMLCQCQDFSLQALRRLVVFGFQSDSRTLQPVAVVTQTVPVLLQALQSLLAARPAKGAPRSQLAVMLDRGLIKLAKVITNVQEVHPW